MKSEGRGECKADAYNTIYRSRVNNWQSVVYIAFWRNGSARDLWPLTMIPKLNLATGIFFAQMPVRLRDVASGCISLLLQVTPVAQRHSSMQYSMLVSVSPSFHMTNLLIGWFNLFQKGFHHRDISIGNVVDAVTIKAFGILKNEG